MTSAVILAHGSPDPRSQVAVREAAAGLGRRTGMRVTVAFLDHDPRNLGGAVGSLNPDDPVVVLPLLLAAAFHARVDVPAAVGALDRAVTLLDPVGHPTALLDELLLRAGGPTVLVSAGTRVDEERSLFARAVADASTRTHVPALAAYATGPGRRLEDAARPGAAVVVPWLLAPGRLLDSVRGSAHAHGCRAEGTGLLHEGTLLDVLARRLRGHAAMPPAAAGG